MRNLISLFLMIIVSFSATSTEKEKALSLIKQSIPLMNEQFHNMGGDRTLESISVDLDGLNYIFSVSIYEDRFGVDDFSSVIAGERVKAMLRTIFRKENVYTQTLIDSEVNVIVRAEGLISKKRHDFYFSASEFRQIINGDTSSKVGALDNLKKVVQEIYIGLPSVLDGHIYFWDLKIENDFVLITIDLVDDVERLQNLKNAKIQSIPDIEIGRFIVYNQNEKIQKLIKPTLDAKMGIKLKFQAFKTNQDDVEFIIPFSVLDACYKFSH